MKATYSKHFTQVLIATSARQTAPFSCQHEQRKFNHASSSRNSKMVRFNEVYKRDENYSLLECASTRTLANDSWAERSLKDVHAFQSSQTSS